MNPRISARTDVSAELPHPSETHDAPHAGAHINVDDGNWRSRVTTLLDKLQGDDGDLEVDEQEILTHCEQWLVRVAGPELDLRCGDDDDFAEFLSSVNDDLFKVLADEAQRRSGVPINSVLLEGSACDTRQIANLAGLHQLEHVVLSGVLETPLTIELPPRVQVDTSRLWGPGVLASTVVQPQAGGESTTTRMTAMIDGPVPAEIEERIVTESLKGPHADLTKLTDHEIWALQSASPHRWAGWVERARALGGTPVETLSIGGKFHLNSALALGIKQLSSLKHLILDPSMAGRPDRVGSINVNVLDLGALQGAGVLGEQIHLQSVHLADAIPEPVLLLLPAGVAAQSTGDLSHHKSWVGRVDIDGRIVEETGLHSLNGQVHLSRARLFETQAQRSGDAQEKALRHNLNLKVLQSFDTSRGTQRMTVNCQLLSALFLKLDAEAQESGERMPWNAFLDEASLAQAMPRELHNEVMRMYQAGSCAMFESNQLGVELRKAFAGMAPGEYRRFGLGAPLHQMALVLHTKQRHDGLEVKTQYVVKLYEPNRSGSTLNIQYGSLSDFDHLTYGDWGGDVTVDFTKSKHYLMTLFRWPPPAIGTAQPVSVSVSREARASGEFLYAAMEDGHAELMEQCIAELALLAPSRPPGFLLQELRAQRTAREPPGLQAAMHSVPYECSRPEVAARYYRAVLNLPDELLDVQSKVDLLSVQFGVVGPLAYALTSQEMSVARLVAAEVLASQALSPRNKIQLLVSDTSMGKLLVEMSYRLQDLENFGEFLTLVLSSPVLPLEAKKELLGTEDWAYHPDNRPANVARRYAIDGPAGAIVLLAIADCAAPEAEKDEMRAQLGFTWDQALWQLNRCIGLRQYRQDEFQATFRGILARIEASAERDKSAS